MLGKATAPSSSSLSVLNMTSLSHRLKEDTWVQWPAQVPLLAPCRLDMCCLGGVVSGVGAHPAQHPGGPLTGGGVGQGGVGGHGQRGQEQPEGDQEGAGEDGEDGWIVLEHYWHLKLPYEL